VKYRHRHRHHLHRYDCEDGSAHEERISIRRSEEESIENTPTNTPAGGKDPKLSGGKGGIGGDEATVEMLRKVG
jgi:hypothetical protein